LLGRGCCGELSRVVFGLSFAFLSFGFGRCGEPSRLFFGLSLPVCVFPRLLVGLMGTSLVCTFAFASVGLGRGQACRLISLGLPPRLFLRSGLGRESLLGLAPRLLLARVQLPHCRLVAVDHVSRHEGRPTLWKTLALP
jgi:hypothetical protein